MAAPPTIAVYISGHGFGHCTRTAVLLEALTRNTQLRLRVVTSCPRWLWPPSLQRVTLEWRTQACDVGAVQHDDLSIDHDATARSLASWRASYQARLQREIEWLGDRTDLVLADLPPLAFDAAAGAGVASVGLANFSWDWIYAAMGFAQSAQEARCAYEKAALLLELTPCAPMPAFRHRLSLGIVGAHADDERDVLRRTIGIQAGESLVLLAFRPPEHTSFLSLPPACPRLRYLWPLGDITRDDVITPPENLRFAQLLVAADVVVAKPGYGIIADAALSETRLLYTERAGFPEDEVLLEWLSRRPGCALLAPERLASGTWRDPLENLLGGPPPLHAEHAERDGAYAGAAALSELLPPGSS